MKTKPLHFRLTWQRVSPNFYFHYSSCIFHLSVRCGYWPIGNLPVVWVWFVPVACLDLYVSEYAPVLMSVPNKWLFLCIGQHRKHGIEKGMGNSTDSGKQYCKHMIKLYPQIVFNIYGGYLSYKVASKSLWCFQQVIPHTDNSGLGASRSTKIKSYAFA